MERFNPLERRLIDWLSRRSDFSLATLPLAAFMIVGAAGLAIISKIANRSPFQDSYIPWVIIVLSIAALVLYLASIEALGVAFIRSRRFKLLELHQTMRDIRVMSWRQFEDLVAASYLARGYDVEQLGGYEPDGGVDLIVRKDHKMWLVQCKHYRNDWIGEPPLRDLLGAVTARKADGGVLVGCGGFDNRARAFAKLSGKLELIGGEQLRDLIADSVGARPTATATSH